MRKPEFITLNLSDWQAADTFVDQLLQLPENERADALEAIQCSASVRLAVNALMESIDRESPLDKPLVQPQNAIAPNAFANQQIGRWRLLEEIGRGGMAVVYRACNIDQPEHIVALKIMQPLRESVKAREYFLQETRTQAKLNHPQLAQFFESGIFEFQNQELMWLAMRWINGEAINDWCDKRQLTVRARLQLFSDLCDAISYAHTQLVVHGDLKPSNVLIENQNARAVVLDFGIARWIDPTQAHIGAPRYLSPSYAAPEQFLGAPPSTAMDVHGLGATLYQLLVGNPPARANAESLPELPSLSVRKKVAVLDGDLDAIVMKAIAPDVQDRYASVDALRADVQRYLQALPVQARSPSRTHRITLWARRNRAAIIAGSAVSAAILAGLAAALYAAQIARAESARARLALEQSLASEQTAKAQQARANELKRFAVGLFESTIPTKPAAEIPSAESLLQSAEARARTDQTIAPAARLEMLLSLSAIYLRRNLTAQALALSDEALQLAPNVADPALHAQALAQRARLDFGKSDFASADQRLSQAEALLRPTLVHSDAWFQLRFEQASSAMFKRDFKVASSILHAEIPPARKNNISADLLLGLLNTQAICLKQQGLLEQAKPYSLETLQLREQKLGASDRAVALSAVNHAGLLVELGEFDSAQTFLQKAQAIYQAINDPSYEPSAAIYRVMGDRAWLMGDLEQAGNHWNEVNQRYATLRKVALARYPFYYSDQAKLALARNDQDQAVMLMQAMRTESAQYLAENGARMNLYALDALSAVTLCRSGQAQAAQAHIQSLQNLDLSTQAKHLHSDYQMALWECALATGETDKAAALEKQILANDAALPKGREIEARLRKARFDATSN